MIVHDVSLPVKQVRIDTYCFRLLLILVILQIETSVVFLFNLRLHIVSDVTKIICKQVGFLKVSQEIEYLLGQCPGRSWSLSGHW